MKNASVDFVIELHLARERKLRNEALRRSLEGATTEGVLAELAALGGFNVSEREGARSVLAKA